MSFCSAVKDNPTLNSAPNPKNVAKKPSNPKNQSGAPPNQPNQNGTQPNNPGQPNQKNYNPKNPTGPPDARFKNNDLRQYRAPAGNKTDVPHQQSGQFNYKPRPPNPTNGVQSFPPRPPPVPSQHNNGTGNKPKNFNNNGPNAGNANPPKHSKGNNLSVEPAFANMSKDTVSDKPASNKLILMVGGLPGKMDFKILKENLQFQANKVHGKVKYVKNGQAFITFNHKSNADRAVELFNGKQVFGKTLNVSFTKAIPFEDQPNGKPKSSGKRFHSRKLSKIIFFTYLSKVPMDLLW